MYSSKVYRWTLYIALQVLAVAGFSQTCTVKFVHIANGKIIHPDSTYHNFLGELYHMQKLKYYITIDRKQGKGEQEHFLVDAYGKDSFSFRMGEHTNLSSLRFMIGVDSTHNCSGAQSGDLDPLNAMFWTWNTGYINFKVEGYSDSSTAANNKFEYHIGGYKPGQQTMHDVNVQFPEPLHLSKNKRTIIYIKTDMDKFWNSKNVISIKDDPVVTQPGTKAVAVSQNIATIFSLIKTIQE